MKAGERLTIWQRWMQQPRTFWLRRALFQIHLWSGIASGLYILMMSLTGSVLVYTNELYRAATPEPIISKASTPRLSDTQIGDRAGRAYPDFRVMRIVRAENPDQAVDVWLRRGREMKQRLFDARSGADLGDSVATGVWLVSKIVDLHDNLFAGRRGRKVNGAGALALLGLAASGIVIWWPGSKAWKRSLMVRRGIGWRRSIWHWHSMIGFWSFAFLIVFGVSGAYLSFPQPFQDFADRWQPAAQATADVRAVDRVIYWLAFLHFGRINGIGIPCGGPGVCDQATKAVWAIFGLAPGAMFVTGAVMWWNRVIKRRFDK